MKKQTDPPRKRRRGPRPHLDVEVIADALRKHEGNIAGAARRLRVHRNTIHAYINKHATLRKLVEELREEFVDVLEKEFRWLVRHREHKGYASAVLFGLRTLGRGRGYGDRTEVVGGPTNTEPVKLLHIYLPEKDPD